MKQAKRPVALMTVAQVICALAIPLTFLLTDPLTALPNIVMMSHLGLIENSIVLHILSALTFLRDLVIGLSLVFVEVEAFRLCGRMKQSSAFSPLNVAGLGRITIALGIAGLVSLLFGDAIVPFLLTGLPPIHPTVQAFLLPFTLLTLALMARAVQVLMRRAVDMQEETELTI